MERDKLKEQAEDQLQQQRIDEERDRRADDDKMKNDQKKRDVEDKRRDDRLRIEARRDEGHTAARDDRKTVVLAPEKPQRQAEASQLRGAPGHTLGSAQAESLAANGAAVEGSRRHAQHTLEQRQMSQRIEQASGPERERLEARRDAAAQQFEANRAEKLKGMGDHIGHDSAKRMGVEAVVKGAQAEKSRERGMTAFERHEQRKRENIEHAHQTGRTVPSQQTHDFADRTEQRVEQVRAEKSQERELDTDKSRSSEQSEDKKRERELTR